MSLQSHGVKSSSRIINTWMPKTSLVLNDVLRPLLYFKYLTHDKTKTKWKSPTFFQETKREHTSIAKVKQYKTINFCLESTSQKVF